jgi:hypothetical protein
MKFLFFIPAIFLINSLNAQNSIKGTWVSTDDKKYSIIIKDSIWIDKYNNELVATHQYFIIKDTMFTFNIPGEEPLKYEILGVTRKFLSLMYLTRGNLLLFRRK